MSLGQTKKVLAMNTWNDRHLMWFGIINNLSYSWFSKINRLKHCTENLDASIS